VALDVYVGSLTRYYARDWQTAGEVAAAELGVPHRTVFADAPDDAVTDPDEIRAAVLVWRAALADSLGGSPADWEWSEGADEPWFSERPAFDGWGALLVRAAYDEHPELERPTHLSEDWMDADPAWRAVAGASPTGLRGLLHRGESEPDVRRYAALYTPELWLPVELDGVFETEDVAGNPISMASVAALLRALSDLNERTFRLGEDEIDHHRRNAEEVEAPLEAKARWGLAVFLWCTARAMEHRLPMKLDY
jgi:hypothetical protein